jgi:hypothetical protein
MQDHSTTASGDALVSMLAAMLNCLFHAWFTFDHLREIPLSEPKQDDSFKVVDRRLFTPDGELRKEVAEQQDREREAPPAAAAKPIAANSAPSTGKPEPAAAPAEPAADLPKAAPAFENLIRSLGQNAAMLLGGYADPRTGQPMLDLEGAREMIDMLDALREKTRGNLAPEEDTLLLDVLGNLKLAFMEMAKAAAKQQEKAQSRP